MSSHSVHIRAEVPLEAYLNNWHSPFPLAYSSDEVKAAIQVFTLEREGMISEPTLEAIISVTNYPELLSLLVNIDITNMWFLIFIEYHKNDQVGHHFDYFTRSTKCLMWSCSFSRGRLEFYLSRSLA